MVCSELPESQGMPWSQLCLIGLGVLGGVSDYCLQALVVKVCTLYGMETVYGRKGNEASLDGPEI